MDHVLTVLFDLFFGAMGGIIAMWVSGSWIRKRAFAAGQKAERGRREYLDRAAKTFGLNHRPGETEEELRERVHLVATSNGHSRAAMRAQLEAMKPAGIELEKWVDAVLGRES